MITSALILTFCTLNTCEEYVIDSKLTRSDCNSALKTERTKLDAIDTDVAYRSYMEQFQAEGMFDADNGVAWELKCETI